MTGNHLKQGQIALISERLEIIRSAMQNAAEKTGRSSEDIQIVTVTKRQPVDIVRAAYACGLRLFGENYPEEAVVKIAETSDLPGIHWEMIGHVQSRKAKLIASQITRLHSLDSEKLAGLMQSHREEHLPALEVLLEVNISGEESKQGLDCADPDKWESILPLVKRLSDYDRLKLVGLMCMPPLQMNMENNRPFFRKTRILRDFIVKNCSGMELSQLSMGTSSDFPVAIEEGATIVRLGEAILGPRPIKESNASYFHNN